MAASTRMIPRIPTLPMEDIAAMGGKFLSGKVTATSGEQIGVCVYTTPTYKILKEEKYRPILITVGLGGVLEMLPLGVDLQACADFMATYDASSQIGTFTSHDGLEIQVHITPQLVADALQMDLTTPKVNPIALPTLKAKGVVQEGTKKGFKYNELLNKELATQLQGFDFLTTWTLVDHANRVSQTALAIVMEGKPCLQYVYSSLLEGLKKRQPVLSNPQLLTRILYFMASIPFCGPETASLKALRAPQSRLTEIKELPLEDPASEEEKVEEEEQQGASSSMMGEKPL